MTLSERCICVNETSRNPNLTCERADPKCKVCHGEGDILLNVSYDRPPIPVRDCDWSTIVDGWEEDGPVGYGATQQQAVDALLAQLIDNYD